MIGLLIIEIMLKIPQIGFGVYNIPKSKTATSVRAALDCGYRLIDTAQMYNNEAEVGEAVNGSGIPRQEIFVTTKISSPCYTYDSAVKSFHQSLDRMHLDYLDMMLIHWPQGGEAETWQALEDMQRQGLVRYIGISNFYPHTLERLQKTAKVKPCIDQIETNVFYQQKPMREYLKKKGIAVQAWSPLGEGSTAIFRNPILNAIGVNHGKTAAQVALRYLVQLGINIIPRSKSPEHIRRNIDILDFVLTDKEMQQISTLDTGHSQYGWPGDAWSY